MKLLKKSKTYNNCNVVIEDHSGLLAVVIYEGSAIQKAQCYPYSPSSKIEKTLKKEAIHLFNEWRQKLMEKNENFLNTFNWV